MTDNRTEIRRRWEELAPDRIGTPEMEASIANEEMVTLELATLGPIPPCPPGCTDERGHGYDSVLDWQDDDDEGCPVFTRLHSFGSTGDGSVEIAQEERYSSTAGFVLLEPYIWQGYEEGACTAEQARRMAAELLNVADRLDEITGATR